MGKKITDFKSNDIILAVWENEAQVNGETKTIINLTINKTYQFNGKWTYTANFSDRNLADIENVISQCKDYLKSK
jgi:hypothetical protein